MTHHSGFGHLLTLIATFFAPIYILMLIIGMVIFFDVMAGRWAAKHGALASGKDPRLVVTSKKTAKGALGKIITYNLAVFTLYLIDRSMINDVAMHYLNVPQLEFAVTKLATLFIVWIEYDSIDEKYYQVKGERIKDKFNRFVRSIKKLVMGVLKFKSHADELKDDK